MTYRDIILEKIAQAPAILDECGVDVWLTFVRETFQPDPALELIWRWGRHLAVSLPHRPKRPSRQPSWASLMRRASVLWGHTRRLLPITFVGIGESLIAALQEYDPTTIAVNYSENDVAADGLSHGMYRLLARYLDGTPYAGRTILYRTHSGRSPGT
ncbi:MAG: hypothetical protein R3C44_16930 [Chloroflexota bacterium]